MDISIKNNIESFNEGVKETANHIHKRIKEFHSTYVTDVIPDFGKYGDTARFAAELIPGVAEYNAISEGDWKGFAIAAGVDITAIAVGTVTAGTGYAAVKGGSSVARVGAKTAAKEIAGSCVKKAMKEISEAGTNKVAMESFQTGVEKGAKEAAETGAKKGAKEVTESHAKKIEKAGIEAGKKIEKRLFKEYISEVEEITGREISQKQKELLRKAIKENDYAKLDKRSYNALKNEYRNKRLSMIKEWEKETDQKWPRYAEDVIGEDGKVLRRKGDYYDGHHIIEVSAGGPNEWWNLHPARYPDEHQGKIHGAGRLAQKIFD